MIEITYSKINQDTLDEYYSKFFIDKEKCKRQLLISKIIIILGCLISIFVLFPLVCLCLIWVFYIFIEQDVKLAIMLCVPVAALFTYKVSGIVLHLAEKLCPLAERYRIEQNLKKELQKYNRFFYLQEFLKNNDVKEVYVSEDLLGAKVYVNEEHFCLKEFDVEKRGSNISVENGLDFSWLDKEIENLVIERTRRTMDGVLIFTLPKDVAYKENREPALGNRICMYCGKQLAKRLDMNNPEDYGLHTPYLDFSGKVACRECEFVVTQTNRILKAIIDGKERERYIKLLEEHISYFPEIYEKNNQTDMEM